jgi:HD-GYP domain-containing protein (c-di-GMP phosphodiesterase class II)
MIGSLYVALPKEDRFQIETAKKAEVDLFVFLSTSGQYVLLVQKGEKPSEAKCSQFEQLWGKNLYIRKTDLDRLNGVPNSTSSNESPPTLDQLAPEEVFNKDILGEPAAQALRQAYKNLVSSVNPELQEVSPTETLKTMSDQILATLLPDLKQQREDILKQLKNVAYMNDASAISAIAVLVALANDFNSKTSLESLVRSTLLMDASLVDIDEETLETYYRNRDELPSHVWEKIKNHPLKSQQLVAYLPIANEIVNQLILTHHELHNGKGYHRGIRSGGVLLLGQVLSLAVDVFERLKSASLNGDKEYSLKVALESFREKHLEPHSRRHPEKLLNNVFKYLGLTV